MVEIYILRQPNAAKASGARAEGDRHAAGDSGSASQCSNLPAEIGRRHRIFNSTSFLATLCRAFLQVLDRKGIATSALHGSGNPRWPGESGRRHESGDAQDLCARWKARNPPHRDDVGTAGWRAWGEHRHLSCYGLVAREPGNSPLPVGRRDRSPTGPVSWRRRSRTGSRNFASSYMAARRCTMFRRF